MTEQHPYNEIEVDENLYQRTFSEDLDPMLLKWHWDEEDRVVSVINDTDWMFQYDNHLPILLKKDMKIYIPKGEFHRLLKGNGELKLLIKKYV